MSHWKACEPAYCSPATMCIGMSPLMSAAVRTLTRWNVITVRDTLGDKLICCLCGRQEKQSQDDSHLHPLCWGIERKKRFGFKKKKEKKIVFLFLKQLAVISGKINPFSSTHGKRQKTNEYDNDFFAFLAFVEVHSTKSDSQTLVRSDRPSI